MHSISRLQTHEWHEVSYLEPARSRRWPLLALSIVLWIAVVDLCWQRTNVAILYVVPVVLLARAGDMRAVWRTAAIAGGLVLGIFFLKNMINPVDSHPRFLDYRLINRILVVGTVLAMARAVQLWVRSREDLQEEELPEVFRRQEREINATLALLLVAPLVALIAMIDFMAPAGINAAILYPIPLFICAWTRSRRLVWATFVLLSLLAVAAFFWPHEPNEPWLIRNRILAVMSMAAVTAALSYWLRREK